MLNNCTIEMVLLSSTVPILTLNRAVGVLFGPFLFLHPLENTTWEACSG